MLRFFLIFFSLFLIWPTSVLRAMSSSNYAIPTDSMNGGGSDTSASANYKIQDTLGQTLIAPVASGSFAAEQGYRTTLASNQLTVNFVDAGGAGIASPLATFAGITAGTTAAAGALTTPSSKIRVTNNRLIAPWSLTIAATAGPSTSWSSGAGALGFNHPAGGNALSIDPSASSVAPRGSLCTSVDLTRGASATFDQGVTDSITLLTAGGSATTGCAWDLTNISLTQTVPAAQAAGVYSISMTIT